MKLKRLLFLITAGVVANPLYALDLDARTGWSDKVSLALPVSGMVKSIGVKAGQVVKQKQVLLSLDCDAYQQQTKEAEAILKAREPVTTRAKRDMELADELFERTVLSVVERDEAHLKYGEAKAQQDIAESRLAQKRWQESYCELHAPYDALILNTHIAAGEMNNTDVASQPLVTLAAQTKRSATAQMTAEQRNAYKISQSVEVQVGDKKYKGKIRAFELTAGPDYKVLPSSSTYNQAVFSLIVDFTVGHDHVYPSQPAIIRLP